VRTYSVQEVVTEYGESLLFDCQEAASKILGGHDLAILDIDTIPEEFQFLYQGEQGNWLMVLSKGCSLFPVMDLTICYDLGEFLVFLGS
jgi:hypothetical protein